jgi:hypothetical protein
MHRKDGRSHRETELFHKKKDMGKRCRNNRQNRAISRAATDSNYLRTMMVTKWIENNGCYQETGRQLGLHASRVWYWVRKMKYPMTFHPGDWGGDKRSTFSEAKKRKLHKLLIVFLRVTPEADATLVHRFVCFLLQRYEVIVKVNLL